MNSNKRHNRRNRRIEPLKITFNGSLTIPILILILLLLLKIFGSSFSWWYLLIIPLGIFFIEMIIFLMLSIIIYVIVKRIESFNNYNKGI